MTARNVEVGAAPCRRSIKGRIAAQPCLYPTVRSACLILLPVGGEYRVLRIPHLPILTLANLFKGMPNTAAHIIVGEYPDTKYLAFLLAYVIHICYVLLYS